MKPLSGKTAIITGASRGIGEATAYELAAQGANVFLTARSREPLEAICNKITESGGNAAFLASTVSRFFGVETVVQRCVETFGSVDILVQNAGVIDPISSIIDSDPLAWAKTIETNLNAVYYGLRATLPLMLEQGSGLIINISSGAAHQPLEGWSHYCAAKAGAAMLTRSAHLETEGSNVCITGLSPGLVATEMQAKIRESGINPVSKIDPSTHIPASWPAKAISWLAQGAAADYAGEEVRLSEDEIRRKIGLISE